MHPDGGSRPPRSPKAEEDISKGVRTEPKVHKKGHPKNNAENNTEKEREVCENAPKMIPNRRPKLMKNRCDFGTCDFFVFTKNKIFKSFFYMSGGSEKLSPIGQTIVQNGVAKVKQKIIKM